MHVWIHELAGDCDYVFIIDGICNGFDIIDKNAELPNIECNNCKLATCPENHLKVESIIEEMRLGCYVICDRKTKFMSSSWAYRNNTVKK